MEEGRFVDKVAVVTGGTSGIGRACAHALVREGARVVVGGRDPVRGEETLQAIEKELGGSARERIVFHQVDVSVPEQVEAFVIRAFSEYGRLDFAFNNAGDCGIDVSSPLHLQDNSSLDDMVATNIKGTFYSMKYEIQHMLQQRSITKTKSKNSTPNLSADFCIVNNSSVSGIRGSIGLSIYCACKHAILGFTRSAALEYRDENIRVNAVAPGQIDTPMLHNAAKRWFEKSTVGSSPFISKEETTREDLNEIFATDIPLGRVGTPEEVAQVVLFLFSQDARAMTGETITVDGGYTLSSINTVQ